MQHDVIDAIQNALENVQRVIDVHGDCATARVEDEPDEPISDLEIAAMYLRDAERLAGDGCACWNGVLWPMGTDGDFSHDWIERCDNCARYEGDDVAALALAGRLGANVFWTTHPTLKRPAPFIDLNRGGASA